MEELGKKFKMPYTFKFIAVREGRYNGIFYPADMLRKAHLTLRGKPLTIDHGKSVDDIIGKINEDVFFNEEILGVQGSATCYEEKYARMIHDKRLNGVSIEIWIDHAETDHGDTAVEGTFVALSIVKDPACPVGQCGIQLTKK